MPTLNIEGRRVKVSDDFLSLSPEDQQKTVEEIAQSLGVTGKAEQPAEDRRPLVERLPVISSMNAFANSMAEGVPVLGGLAENAADFVGSNIASLISGKPQEETLEVGKISRQQQRDAHPVASTAGYVTGTVGPLAALGAPGASAQTAANLGGRTASIPQASPQVMRAMGMQGSLPARMGYGGLSGMGLAGADTFARTGDIKESAQNAAIGGVIGGVAPAVTQGASDLVKAGWSRVMKRMSGKMPTVDDLQMAKNALYQRADKLGARYSADAYDDFVTRAIKDAADDNISPTRHPQAFSFLEDLEKRRGPKSLTELDQLRQEIRRDVVNRADEAEAHFGRMMIDALDDFIENAKPSQMMTGNAAQAAEAITQARQANSIWRKSELLEDAVVKAYRRAASTGSGGNIDNALRQNIRQILDNPKKVRAFSQAEREVMEQIVSGGGKVQDLVRLIGKLSPSGNGLMAALGIGATAHNPLMAIPIGAGIAAKATSDRATQSAVNALQGQVRTGGAAAAAQSAKPAGLGQYLMQERRAVLPPALFPVLAQ